MTIQWEQSDSNVADPKSSPSTNAKSNSGKKKLHFRSLVAPIAIGSFAALVQCALFSGRSPISVMRPSINILVAQETIARGTAIEDVPLALMETDNDNLSNMFLTEADLKKAKGRRFLVGIAAGQAIPKAFLLSDFQQKSVPEKIPPGKRLFIFEAALGELGSLLKPTDHIDVVADMTVPDFGQTTLTLLENITIIGIGSDIDGTTSREKTHTNSISLYVTPQEAEFLTFAKKYGKFSVVLRNPMDATVTKHTNGGMTLNQFLDSPRIKGVRENDIFEIIKGRKIK